MQASEASQKEQQLKTAVSGAAKLQEKLDVAMEGAQKVTTELEMQKQFADEHQASQPLLGQLDKHA